MSKQANPFAIGAFLVGALTLLIAAVMIFGGNDFFKQKKQFVIFFDSALNGLNIGAPVKLQGVQIGSVKEISLEMDASTGRIFKPVVVEIEPELLRDLSARKARVDAKHEHDHKQDRQQLVDLGLKARLETQSLLTGLLYIELDFYYGKQTNLVNMDYKDLPELPSVPTTVDEIRNTADEVIKKIRELPLEAMVKDLSETLREAHDLLKSDDTKKSVHALAASLQETQKLIATLNTQIVPVLDNANGAMIETRVTLQDFNKQMLPVLKAAEQSLNAATRILQESQHTLNAVETMATPDSQLGLALQEMHNAAKSFKNLADTLERQPDAIIYGK